MVAQRLHQVVEDSSGSILCASHKVALKQVKVECEPNSTQSRLVNLEDLVDAANDLTTSLQQPDTPHLPL